MKLFNTINLNHIQPQGWLYDQLKIQAQSMSGHLDEFWPDVKDSSWFGGNAEGWERAPYWLDGFIPLAFLLQDQSLINKAKKYVTYIIEHQCEDGWLGPKSSNTSNPEAKAHYDLWAQFLILKVLCQYHDITQEPKVILCVEKALKKIDQYIDWNPLFDWGQARWFECLIAIKWLYDRKPESWLLDLATKLQAQGFNWKALFANYPYKQATPKGKWSFMSHVVNNAMAIKAYGVVNTLFPQDPELKVTCDHIISILDQYHGNATGTFTGDECLAGKDPSRGTELCAIVEYMYSLEKLLEIYGDPSYADRLEKIAFNALPAAFTKDMWAHQYDEQINQIRCAIDPKMPWSTNDPDANIFGLAPHFGCCTSNYHQGFPKFASHQWLQAQDGVMIAYYAPSKLNTTINGIATTIIQKTDYPFKSTIDVIVECEQDNDFALYLRVPAWCKNPVITINQENYTVNSQGYFKLNRKWEKQTTIHIDLNMELRCEYGINNSVNVFRGPLLLALPLAYEQVQVNTNDPLKQKPHCDYEFNPQGAFNYALDLSSLGQVSEHEVNTVPFGEKVALSVNCQVQTIEQWTSNGAIALEIPTSPVNNAGQSETKQLVPFASTMLRIAQFPFYHSKS